MPMLCHVKIRQYDGVCMFLTLSEKADKVLQKEEKDRSGADVCGHSSSPAIRNDAKYRYVCVINGKNNGIDSIAQ